MPDPAPQGGLFAALLPDNLFELIGVVFDALEFPNEENVQEHGGGKDDDELELEFGLHGAE